MLEEADVERAVESARKMRRGREMQGPVLGEDSVEEGGGKRKYSIRQEVDDEEEIKRKKTVKRGLESIHEEPSSFDLNGYGVENLTLLPITPISPHTTKRRDTLPRIITHALQSPQPHTPLTPLFNANNTPCPVDLDTTLHIQAAQMATHEFNVCRVAVEDARVVFEEAVRRLGDARVRMERARDGVLDGGVINLGRSVG
jgi:hypothetical protein